MLQLLLGTQADVLHLRHMHSAPVHLSVDDGEVAPAVPCSPPADGLNSSWPCFIGRGERSFIYFNVQLAGYEASSYFVSPETLGAIAAQSVYGIFVPISHSFCFPTWKVVNHICRAKSSKIVLCRPLVF